MGALTTLSLALAVGATGFGDDGIGGDVTGFGGVRFTVRAPLPGPARASLAIDRAQHPQSVTHRVEVAASVDSSTLVATDLGDRQARTGHPQDIAYAALYLASDASRYHTGDVIRVDGGYAIF